jgi:hypothetical protein
MSSMDDQGARPDRAMTAVDEWVPDDREPSAAENNFVSFALFGFLILFGISCFVVF